MSPEIHSSSLCESKHIGSGTKVSAFTHIFQEAKVGENCTIGHSVVIDNAVTIGNYVTIGNGCQLLTNLQIADNVTIGPNAIFILEDPGSFHNEEKSTVAADVCIGGNCTILSGTKIGRGARIKPGTVVAKDVPAKAIVEGNPGYIIGYITSETLSPSRHRSSRQHEKESSWTTRTTSLPNVTLQRFKSISDLRGSLAVGNFMDNIPFQPKRFFFTYDVPGKHVRGEHAHKKCHQFLISVSGEIAILVDNGKDSEELILDSPNIGLYLPPKIWSVQYKYSKDARLLVFASNEYDPDDYIRDYEEFLEIIRHPPRIQPSAG